jgi:hypothetical protein
MNRAQGTALLFLGGLLIFLGVFGSQTFGNTLTLTNGFSDAFNVPYSFVLSPWTEFFRGYGIITVVPEGMVRFSTSTIFAGAYDGAAIATTSDYALASSNISVDVVETGSQSAPFLLISNVIKPDINFDGTQSYYIAVQFDDNYPNGQLMVARTTGGTAQRLLTNVISLDPLIPFSLGISINNGEIQFLLDNAVRYQEAYQIGTSNCHVWLGSLQPMVGMQEVNFDNFTMTISPSNWSPPTNVTNIFSNPQVKLGLVFGGVFCLGTGFVGVIFGKPENA